MSISKPYGKNSGKVPGKKYFTQACNLLNQYLKENGSLRDLDMINGIVRPETSQTMTVDFLSNMEKPSPAPEYSLPPLPQFIDVESFLSGGKASSSQPPPVETETAVLTIFYGGQVMVFNDFSEEKVRELMMIASSSTSTTSGEKIERGKAPMTSPVNSVLGGNGSDLPIARRASLHKFLAKRKDRATARAAPYQVSQKDEPKFDLNL